MHKIVALFVLMGVSVVAHADSDGNFCIGPSYIAYELSFNGPAPHKHQLHILRLTDQRSWRDPYTLDLPEFQTHGMMCSESVVKVLGWDAIYTASWTNTDSRPTIARKPIEPGKFDGLEIPQLIDNFLSTQRRIIWLSTSSSEYSFLLWIEAPAHRNGQCGDVPVRSYIERRRGQQVVDEKVLYAGTLPAECGE